MLCCLPWVAGSEVIIQKLFLQKDTTFPSQHMAVEGLCVLHWLPGSTKGISPVPVLAGAPQQIFLCSHRLLAAGEYVKFPEGNAGAFWPLLKFSVPIYLQLKAVSHACSCIAQFSYKSLHTSAAKILKDCSGYF